MNTMRELLDELKRLEREYRHSEYLYERRVYVDASLNASPLLIEALELSLTTILNSDLLDFRDMNQVIIKLDALAREVGK